VAFANFEHLNVYGGLEGLLKQLVPLKPGA